jgi:anti-sigma B factor antagonist
LAATPQEERLLQVRPREEQMEFAVSTKWLDTDTFVVSLRGEVDLYTAPAFERDLQNAIQLGATRVIVDLSETTFFDSSGLDVLMSGRKRLSERGGEISVICSDPKIQKVFEITRLDRVISIHRAIAQALDAWVRQPRQGFEPSS